MDTDATHRNPFSKIDEPGDPSDVTMAIWGVGAVGIGLASALARESDPLRLIGRDPRTRHALEAQGILRTGRFGDVHVPPNRLRLESDPEALRADPPEWLLVCTKSFATREIADILEPFADALLPHTRLLLCQNGWGNERAFARFWPPNRLFHARIITGFHRRSVHEVEVTAHAAPIALGSLTDLDAMSAAALARLALRISEGGLPAEMVDDMRGVLWAKMLYNCALNPLGALAGRRYGELTADPSTRALVDEVIREIFRVLDAAGIAVAWPNADRYLETFHAELIPVTAEHESSMLQDLRARRPTEIEALCGAVERLAREHGVATPVVSALAALVRAAESRSSG